MCIERFCNCPPSNRVEVTGTGDTPPIRVFGKDRWDVFELRSRLGIVSASGGGGVLASDLADDAALAVPLLSIAVQDEVMRHIPPFGTPANPIDVTGQGPENRHDFAHVLDTIALSGEVDAVMCVFSSHGPIAVSVAETIAGAYERSGIPFVASWGSPDIAALDVFHAAGLPAYRNPRNAINALSAAATLHSPWTRSAGSTIEHPPHRSADCALCSDNSTGRLVLEAEAQQFLVQYGVVAAASREARGRDEAIAAAEELGYPLVLKLIAEQVPHREKAGAISFNVCSAAAVAHEFTRLTDLAAPGTVCSVLVAEQLPRGVEVMVGASRDREWGTTVLVGIGGSHAELIDRSALRLSPLSTTAAASAVREVFLDHLDADAVDAVARVASGVARAMDDHPHIESIDINPLIITPGGPVAVDALIATTPTDHIAI